MREQMTDDRCWWWQVADTVDVVGLERLYVLGDCGSETAELWPKPFTDQP